MKRFSTPLLAALGALSAGSCSPAVSAAEALVFVPGPETEDPERPYYHDFGRVPAGEMLEHVFHLENQSTAPIRITDIVPACGCTVPALEYTDAAGQVVESRPIIGGQTPKEPLLAIPAGLRARLSIRVDPDRVRPPNTHKLHTTRITTDSEILPYLTVETHVLVEVPFQVVPEGIELGRLPIGGGGTTTNRISLLSGYDLRLTGKFETTDALQAELVQKEEFGSPFWELTTTIDPPLPKGRISGSITFETSSADGSPAAPLVLPMSAFGVVDLQTTPTRMILVVDPDPMQTSTTSTELFSLLGGKRLTVSNATLPPEHEDYLSVAIEPVAADARGRSERWKVSLSTKPPLVQNVLRGTITLELIGEEDSQFEINYVVHQR